MVPVSEDKKFWKGIVGTVIGGLILTLVIGAGGVMVKLAVLSETVGTMNERLKRIEMYFDRSTAEKTNEPND